MRGQVPSRRAPASESGAYLAELPQRTTGGWREEEEEEQDFPEEEASRDRARRTRGLDAVMSAARFLLRFGPLMVWLAARLAGP